eukprot:m.39598 g.39598  ORF g.39598 m.39598 type:complete len:64 (+) comp6876_c0_seq1:343-534(+)
MSIFVMDVCRRTCFEHCTSCTLDRKEGLEVFAYMKRELFPFHECVSQQGQPLRSLGKRDKGYV